MRIPIYAKEKELGLDDKIQASRVLAYYSPVSKFTPTKTIASQVKDCKACDKVLAAIEDNDLYYIQSILVSTNVNKNDDAFHPQAVWAARHTPNHKPFNYEHDETKSAGHIIDTWAVDANYDLIEDSTPVDELPSFFHLLNASVLYRQWENPELSKRVEEAIAKVEEDKAFCSMEALIFNFDYLLKSEEDSTYKIIARNEESSFLTRHLRAYGGTGLYDNHRLFRLISACKFTACGIVENPANEDSLVFNPKDHFNFKSVGVSKVRAGSIPNQKQDSLENKMSEADKQVEKLQARIDELEAERQESFKKAIEADRKMWDAEKASLNDELKVVKEEKEAVASELKQNKEKIEALKEGVDEFKADLEKANKELEEVKAKEVRSNRINTLVAGKFTQEEAEAKVDKYTSLSDEQFEDLAKELTEARFNFEKKDKEDKEKKKDKSESKVDASTVIEEIEAEKTPDLSTAGHKKDNTELIKSVANLLRSRVQKGDK